MRRRIYRAALRRLNARCIAVSTAAAEHAAVDLRLDSPPQVVLNGIDFERLRLDERHQRGGGGQGPFVIGTAGRFAREKGHRHLIEAVAQLRASGVDVRLRIAGTGNLLASYQQLIREHQLDGFVDLPGRVDDMGAFYCSLDAFVLPSLEREGLPRVLLEAMACGCPCIAADCEGVGDVLSDGQTGLVVPRGDAAAIAGALACLANDDTLRDQLAESGRHHAITNFSVERVRNEVEDLYNDLILR